MSYYKSRGRWVIYLSFLIGIILQIMPWPQQIYMFQPSWLLLIFIYWVMALPHRVNLGTGFILGLITDLLLGSTLGIHSLGMSMIAYLVTIKFQILRNMTLWQQTLFVILLSITMTTTVFLTEFLIIHVSFNADIFLNTLTNAMLWPWLFLLMRKIRRKFLVQ
ncbi:rod shape-determining protein MreD [Candidatus Williamhamiltonella defendens]|uniref:Rod shape-determining protein MreD n=1 Tax=Candidatus Hamiltonella defensa (Bemisia tabaci) TaxID=672795 RepID=A0A249DXF2_9ENTR|nr:rod shape-determining protein MreD [Candidatus Hamiltonella defensa]ASX26039.1 rod shape-determining protein MreD [Candidatus Hamiltonella defensa (Bemisia tabaci)]CED78877.1 Rod shape-determining protein mreD [Candidatus Hamiltonella defensa (Bemisia tabaci)]